MATKYALDFGQTVYGGKINLATGTLIVEWANIDSYNGETITEPWLSSMDVYSAGATPTTGAQVVYKLATPIEYTLTPQQLTTLLGVNNVWSNDGDISELIYMFTNEIFINNEGMPAIPTINASEAGPTVTLRGSSHVLAAGDNRFSDFILQSGENVMQVEDPAGTLTIKYQEGML